MTNPCMHEKLAGRFSLPRACGKESKWTDTIDDGRVVANYCNAHKSDAKYIVIPATIEA